MGWIIIEAEAMGLRGVGHLKQFLTDLIQQVLRPIWDISLVIGVGERIT